MAFLYWNPALRCHVRLSSVEWLHQAILKDQPKRGLWVWEECGAIPLFVAAACAAAVGGEMVEVVDAP